MWTTKYQPVLAPDGEGAPGSSGTPAGAAPAPAAPAGAGAAAAAPAPWYGDKIDQTTLGLWKNKGIDASDPIAVASKLTDFYRNAEKFVGAPPEEMIRIPKANAPEADIRAYWNRVGVPLEAKDYDLSAVKFSDGKELDSGFTDMFRAAAHSARVPKEQATGLLASLVKHMESNDAAELAEKTRIIADQQKALDANWGTNKTYNLAIAQRALEDLGKASGLTPEQTRQAWDALSSVGGIGASYAMEMLRNIGSRMGEGKFIPSEPGQGLENKVMSRDQAKAEIESLKSDNGFYKQLMAGSVEAKRRWSDLHKIAFAA